MEISCCKDQITSNTYNDPLLHLLTTIESRDSASFFRSWDPNFVFFPAVAVYVVMELCGGGEPFDRIIQKGHYTERKAAELAQVIVGAIEVCHLLGVMHRDLKNEFQHLLHEIVPEGIHHELSHMMDDPIKISHSLHEVSPHQSAAWWKRRALKPQTMRTRPPSHTQAFIKMW